MEAKHIDILIHMLGAGTHIRKSDRGYRNGFCAEIGGDDYKSLLEMEAAGLVTASLKINDGRDQYFVATPAGGKAAGLSRAEIKRVFGADP